MFGNSRRAKAINLSLPSGGLSRILRCPENGIFDTRKTRSSTPLNAVFDRICFLKDQLGMTNPRFYRGDPRLNTSQGFSPSYLFKMGRARRPAPTGSPDGVLSRILRCPEDGIIDPVGRSLRQDMLFEGPTRND